MFTTLLFFFDDESDNYGSGSGSSGMCSFPFSTGNYVGRVIDSGYEMGKCYFPFCDGEMVKCSFPFFDGEMVKCCFPFFGGEMMN